MAHRVYANQAEEDRAALRRLGGIIGGFILATAIMAITIGVIMG